ncbi:alcohol dehydrogenase [Lineolata rhizophorae]|uniref:Alcohol dehydrogenase n=1 Tax=Lineolata rhizophorae TaxID=578093 RepID=A0A6A6PEL0_9PEZI|nr:alcohol dehydrogenase [Lineolata rhizophorae]
MSPTIPQTYKAAVIEEVGKPLVVKELPVPKPQPGEVLIKSLACGICHSDAAVQSGAFPTKLPLVPGHEVVGEVVAVGEGEKRWQVGDRVGGPWHGGHDGICKACNRGLFQMCQNAAVNGVTRNGGYGEYATLRSEAVVDIPKDVNPAEVAPLLCAGVTVFNGIRNMGIVPGDVVAIQGLGGLGHLALQFSRRMGYRTVALSSSSAKKDFAMKLGANDYVDTSKEDTVSALKAMGGASLVVVTAPNPKIMGPLVNACGPLGKVLVLAPVGNIPVNTIAMIGQGVSVHGWPSGHANDSVETIDFAKRQDVNCMIEKFKLSQVNEAMDKMMKGDIRFRGVLVFD